MRTGIASRTRDLAVHAVQLQVSGNVGILVLGDRRKARHHGTGNGSHREAGCDDLEMSASWVSEEMVVSEMGARLSPKMALEMMAPHISPC